MPSADRADRQPLSDEDARILALEDGPVRGHTCKVAVVDGAIGLQALRERVAERLARERLLAMRLVDGDPPSWEPDPALAVERHVRHRGSVDDAGLRGVVGRLMAERLPRDRPLWALDAVLVDGCRTALVWRIHHALADGMTTMRMVRTVLLDDQEPGAREAPLAPATHAATSGGPPSSKPRSRLAPLRGALHAPAALRRELARRGAETPLDADVCDDREVAFADAGLAEVKRIAHALPERATVNDVVLAAVAGGLRTWLGGLGAHPRALRVKVPVSLHRPGDDAGNRDSFICVDLPIEQPDPVERLRAIAAETRARKRDHDAETLDHFFRDLSHVSASLARFAEHWALSPRVFTLNVSNVPGPPGPLSVLGAPVASLHSLAEIAHRHALRIAVVSAGGRIAFGFCADAEAVGSPQPVADGLVAELRTLGDSLR